MKKLFAMLVVGGILAAGVVGCGPAATTGNPPPPPPPPKVTPKEVKTSGKVTKSDAGKITVKPETGDAKDFTIADDKVVTIDDKAGKAADIKDGSTVTVTETDGKITKVEVKSAAVVVPPADKPPTDKPADKPPTDKPADKPPTDKPADKPPADKPPTDKPADKPPADKPPTDKPAPAAKVTTGKVTKSADGKITVKPETGDSKDFTVDEKTLTIDGAPGKAADIKEGASVTVTETDGKVTKIEVKK